MSVFSPFRILGPSGSSRGYEDRPPRDPWLMVPRTTTRALTLSVDDSQHLNIRNADDRGNIRNRMGLPVCRVRAVGNQLIIEGLIDYRDIPIELVHRGRELRVMVSVKKRASLPILAHYVEHGPLLKTRMTRERLSEVLDHANAFLRQANVRLYLADDRVLEHEQIFRRDPATKDADSKVSSKRSLGLIVKNRDEYELLVKHRLTLPRLDHLQYEPLNVFFVRDVEYGDLARFDRDVQLGNTTLEQEKGVRLAAFTDSVGNCIFEDQRTPHGVFEEGRTLAHEAVHHLLHLKGMTGKLDARDSSGKHHVKNDPFNLMSDKRERFHATRLTREQIEAINFSLAFKPHDGRIKIA